jgi:SNF2 family DNA or RNA helicase
MVATKAKTIAAPAENKAVKASKTVESTKSPLAESTNEKAGAKAPSLPKDGSAVETDSETPFKESSKVCEVKPKKRQSPTQEPEEHPDAKKIAVQAEGESTNNTEAPDEIDQLTDAAANMSIDIPAEDDKTEEAAKKERIVQRMELDKLFADSMLKDQVPDMKMPDALNIELFPYQEDGVRWLVFQENNVDSVPPFWKQRQMGSKLKWWCPITNVYQDEKPAPIRGSILADGK